MTATTQTLSASDVDTRDLNQVAALAETLPQGSPLAVVMQHLVAAVRKGRDVTILASDEHLTPNQAADLLHVSRPHLLKFMDNGELDFYRVGNRRRIRMADLLDFIARRERAKATVASAFGNPALVEQALRDGATELTDSDLDELNAL
ncbi:helix-turn-helix domain-containing protein [Phytoactinopolyspora limicola]|uniref:helix-turn-helix domain-containing protein n=1 Tax=Phytoactinopolyspora limicola TaxID=2715536 RepID=UPI00140902D9|nr:helix-turn-helix domain-containing protein [Phytoactinopolyspora limicola]